MKAAQLLLGSDIGLWAVEFVEPASVTQVVAEDPEIRRVARRRGIAASTRPKSAWRTLSIHYPRILSHEELTSLGPTYNLHPGFLPWGRGHFPLVWAILDDEPAGATLHRMVARLDAGSIVDQTRVAVLADDTGGSLHARLRHAEREMLRKWWPRLLNDSPITERPQASGGSYHTKAEFESLLASDPRSVGPAILDRLRRALTFPGKPGLGT